MSKELEQKVRNWLLDPRRLSADKKRVFPLGKPCAQDIEDVIALLDWPENKHWHSNIEMGASVVWGELAMRRVS